MGHGFTARDGWFVDPHGRRTLLRGVNLGGSTKVPYTPDGATQLGVDFAGWRDVSFVGRPAPLDEIDRHLDRIAHWGFDVLRLLVTWEAIEHAGPGEHDESYLDYVREVVRRAGARGLLVFIDPHQDVWSRWTGGDGAPYWTLECAGLRPDRFVEADAVALHAFDWPSGYDRVPAATMWTLFFGGDAFCPELAGVQERLQAAYLGAIGALAARIADLDCVLGYDTLNEPNAGYLGRGRDLATPRRFFAGDGPAPRSPLQHLAAAEAGGIWRDGCPWRRAGVWDLDASGDPVLVDERYFTESNGEPVEVWADFMAPFARRFRDSVRARHADCFVFLEGSPFELDTQWRDPDPLVCNARHWYDVVALATRKFDPAPGAAAISEGFVKQLSGLQRISRDRMGDPPMLIGEFGIPYEMNDAHAYRTGDYSAQEVALDANYRALETLLLHSTQWNYTADNTHEHGDQWNDEDLSIFSADDVSPDSSPDDLEAGGRATRAFCRPYVRHAAGTPVRMAFDLDAGVFEAEIDRDAAVEGPTVVYVPALHYPDGPAVEVSAGTASYDVVTQLLTWHLPEDAGRSTLCLRRP